jgi:hypoxanthine phosphoribosyltransferase
MSFYVATLSNGVSSTKDSGATLDTLLEWVKDNAPPTVDKIIIQLKKEAGTTPKTVTVENRKTKKLARKELRKLKSALLPKEEKKVKKTGRVLRFVEDS